MRLKKSSRYLALEDAIFDSRIPLRSEEEFRVGITFVVKLVGCGTVPRPNTRMEIVASMRRIRAECRMRKEKKRKVVLVVSYEGVKVSLPGTTGKKKQSKNTAAAASVVIHQHPIHRIFYVSHDSLDLHIFSYIAREGSSFKCFVFKAAKQALAVNVVRTIGQAFELCHKMTSFINECTTNTTASNNNSSSTANSTTTTADQIEDQRRDSRQTNRSTTAALPDDDADDDDGTAGSHPASSSAASTVVNNNNITNATDNNNDFVDGRPNPRKDLSLNMEKMIHDVDHKLDKLNDKIDLLERQITFLLSTVEISNAGNGTTNNKNNSDSGSTQKPTTISPVETKTRSLEYTPAVSATPVEQKIKSESPSQLNSPDSLLSSPVRYNPDVVLGSCLLFKDLY